MARDPYLDALDPMTGQMANGLDPSSLNTAPDPYAVLPPELQAMDQSQFDPGGLGGFAERFAGGLQGLDLQPTGFGTGILSGFARGLGGRGQQVAQRRQAFEERQKQINRAREQANLAATEKYREDKAKAAEAKAKAEAAAREHGLKYVKLGPDEAAKFPHLVQAYGENVPRDEYAKASAPPKPETPAERRAAEAALRAAAAQERANRLANATTLNQVADDYKQDTAIKAYTGVRSNLMTGETAAKQQNGAGDIALIFSYMRALEPDNPNVVREGDVALVRQAVPLLQRAASIPKRFFTGDQLTPEGRQYFLGQMRTALKSRRPDFDEANAQFKRRAEAFGADPSLFMREHPEQGQAVDPKGRPSLSGGWQ